MSVLPGVLDAPQLRKTRVIDGKSRTVKIVRLDGDNAWVLWYHITPSGGKWRAYRDPIPLAELTRWDLVGPGPTSRQDEACQANTPAPKRTRACKPRARRNSKAR